MDSELASLFTKQGVEPSTVTWNESLHLLSVTLWASCGDDIADITKLAKSGPNPDNIAEAARLKAVWKKCVALHKRRDQLEAEGLPIEDAGILCLSTPPRRDLCGIFLL